MTEKKELKSILASQGFSVLFVPHNREDRKPLASEGG
jgi:hypothetical protein